MRLSHAMPLAHELFEMDGWENPLGGTPIPRVTADFSQAAFLGYFGAGRNFFSILRHDTWASRPATASEIAEFARLIGVAPDSIAPRLTEHFPIDGRERSLNRYVATGDEAAHYASGDELHSRRDLGERSSAAKATLRLATLAVISSPAPEPGVLSGP